MVNRSIEIKRIVTWLPYLYIFGKRLTIFQVSNSTILPPNCFHPAFQTNVKWEISEPSSNWKEQGRLACKALTLKWLTVAVNRCGHSCALTKHMEPGSCRVACNGNISD